MYATSIGDILRRFSYSNLTSSKDNKTNNENEDKPSLTISILGDVTYGACCIDDLTALSLQSDLLVHYGHSCLVPTTQTVVPCLYVFVEIRVDVGHLVECVRLTFEGEEECEDVTDKRVVECAVMGTVQFRSAVVEAAKRLNELKIDDSTDDMAADSTSSSAKGGKKVYVEYQAIVPQAKPLSPGEVLGCTAPSGLATMNWREAMMSPRERREVAKQTTDSTSTASSTSSSKPERVMIFLADGRFHLEAAMISNPSLRALRYDPYSKTLTEEKYEIVQMKRLRREAVRKVRDLLGVNLSPGYRVETVSLGTPKSGEDVVDSLLMQPTLSISSTPSNTSQTLPSNPTQRTIGIILGTLGRQGNPGILARIRSLLQKRGVRTMIVLLSEIFPKKLELLSKGVDGKGGVCAWVQIACPRLR